MANAKIVKLLTCYLDRVDNALKYVEMEGTMVSFNVMTATLKMETDVLQIAK